MIVETSEKTPGMEANSDERILDKLYVLDFDRTLVDSTRLGILLLDAVDELGVDTTTLRKRLETERGNSLQLLDAVEEKIGTGRMDELRKRFIALSEKARTKKYKDGGFFEPGAHFLLGSIPSGHRMIFTYGDNEEWQAWKLEAAGLINQQYAITTERGEDGKPVPKPELLADMKQEDGTFAVSNIRGDQPILARELVMIDDKPENLTNLPAGITAHLYYPKRVKKDFRENHPTKYEKHKRFIEQHPEVRRLKKLRHLFGRYALGASGDSDSDVRAA